jgi:DMSO/TMAO reductase YedYZ molybdopterin-dependent catalytic subunit
MTRREFVLLPGACSLLGQAPAAPEPQELAPQNLAPQNLSFPLESIQGAITPPDLFFVRDHFSEPELSLSSWKLSVEGRVTHPLELTLADIIERPTKKLEAVLECAGNAAGGSAASNAVWEGVPLARLLNEAGAAAEAASVVLEGADSGRLMPDSPALPYCQIVPVEKCMRSESLVAFKLNDRFLARRNGFPARALFPGWYAMDSVKWLQRIVVLGPADEPRDFQQSGMNKVYNRILEVSPGNRKTTRLSEILVKSAIAWPANDMKLPAARHVIRGFAWTGAGLVRGVEITTDGGNTWAPAKLEFRAKAFSWVRWNYSWNAAVGDHLLMSRAMDDAGRRQPIKRDSMRKDGYELNSCAPVRCAVR